MAQDYFIYAGRLEEIKGIRILMEAWGQMGKDAPKLVVCGIGPLEGWCRAYAEEKGLDSVLFMGFVENRRLRLLIAEAEALIVPSQWYEGFPMIIVEAFSAGVPVIGSDFGNVGNLIENGVTGEKFLSDSPESLGRAVMRVYKNKGIYTGLKNNPVYSVDRNYKQLISIYKQISAIPT